MNSTLPVACMIFDMDGTLTRTNDLIFASFNHVAEKYAGRTLTPVEIVALFGPPEEGALAKIIDGDRTGKAMDDLCDFYRTHHARLASLHSGVREMLEYLKGTGVKTAIFTGKGRRTASITLEEFGLASYFDVIVSGNDVDRHKPHPEGILRVLKQCAVPPQATIMTGDSVADIMASRGAGVRSVAVLWDAFDSEGVRRAGPDHTFSTVAAMDAWVRSEVHC